MISKLSDISMRKILFLVIILCSLVYLLPYIFKYLRGSSSCSVDSCIKRHMKDSAQMFQNYDAIMLSPDSSNADVHSEGFPFVGNGKIGFVVDHKNPMLSIFYDSFPQDGVPNVGQDMLPFVSLPVDFITKPEHITAYEKRDDALFVDFHHGIVNKLSCHAVGDPHGNCIYINHTFIAHRSRPNLFLQQIDVSFGSGMTFIDEVLHLQKSDWMSVINFKQTSKSAFPSRQYKLYQGKIEIPKTKKWMIIVIGTSNAPEVVHLKHGTASLHILNVVMHSSPIVDQSQEQTAIKETVKQAVNYMDELININSQQLFDEHKSAWDDIWHTGLSIKMSPSSEPNIPEPRLVNATLYYVLSLMDSKLHHQDIHENQRQQLRKRLQTPDFCFTGHPTVHAQKLWTYVSNTQELVELTKLWSITLRKKGCSNLLSEGAEGFLQAIVLSFGGLQFTKNDLQFNTEPDILHNQITFHNIIYKNDTIDISMLYYNGETSMQVSLADKNQLPLYACEAGCSSPIVQLTKQAKILPVYVTDPLTSILYISHDRQHLLELKDTLHLNKIMEHSEHMKGKQSGLPTILWISIGSLIILFHLYLIRLIIKEYNTTSLSKSSRNYYSNRGRLAS